MAASAFRSTFEWWPLLAAVAHLAQAKQGGGRAADPGATSAVALAQHYSPYDTWLVEQRITPCAVTLHCRGRLGNQLLGAYCALHAARTMRTRLQFKGAPKCYHGMLKPPDGGPEDVLWGMQFGNPDKQCVGTLTVDGWLEHPGVDPQDKDIRTSFHYLYSAMHFPVATDTLPASDELVIYLRSGDIFDPLEDPKEHETYVWAPCSFFHRIIRESGTPEDKVVFLTDLSELEGEGRNPCWGQMHARYPRAKFLGQGTSVAHDFGYLVHATNLVLGGVSTFGQMAAYLSPTLRNLYIFSWTVSGGEGGPAHLNPVFWTLGAFDWPGVNPRHYVARNLTVGAKLPDVMPVMMTYPEDAYDAISAAEYWERYVVGRGVVVPLTVTVLVGCDPGSWQATLQKIQAMKLAWTVQGRIKHRPVPTVAFVPKAWGSNMLRELRQLGSFAESRYYCSVFSPSGGHPNGTLLDTGDTRYCGASLLLAYVLQVLQENPWSTTHFVWLRESKSAADLAGVMPLVYHLTKSRLNEIVFLTRPLGGTGDSAKQLPGGSSEKVLGAVLPVSLFRPGRLDPKWAAAAQRGMVWSDFMYRQYAQQRRGGARAT